MTRVVARALWIGALCLCVATAHAETQQETFDAAKAYGAARARSTHAAVRDGTAENETVRRTVPGYTASPTQAQSYRNQDGASQAAQQDAACQQTPSDPACAAYRVGAQTRPASTLSPSSPALAGAAAGSNPAGVLGDIASTYNACSVGGAMTAAASWARQSCTLQTTSWADQVCTKSLEVFPVQSSSCVAGSVIASSHIDGEGPIDVQAYCNPASGPRVRIAASAVGGHGACVAPIDTVVDLSQPQPLGATPPTRIGELQPHWFGGCFALEVYWEGTGCQGGACKLRVHLVQGPGTEPTSACASPDETRGADIAFVAWDSPPADYTQQCYSAFADEAAAAGRVGAWGDHAGTFAYWAQTSAPVVTGWQWAAGLHYTADLSFTEPRIIPPRGDVWTNACKPFEDKTGQLLPDGISSGAAIAMPVVTSAGTDQCVRTDSVCTDGPSTRVVDGLSVTRACWSYTNRFACTQLASTSTCASSDLRACNQVGSSTCAQQDGSGHCLQADAVFECKTAEASFSPALNCGSASFCSGGSCWDSVSQPSGSFYSSVAQLQAHIAAGKDIDQTTLQIFKGLDRRCHKDSFGIDNCCDNSAYLQQCSDAEQETVRQREQGRCHEVGQYCSAGSILGCRERTKTYCCFSSMLGRIVQEQGRLQVARDWGTPQSPDCVGFTPDELARLDWSRFDLSEFYAQIQPAAPASQGTVSSNTQNKQASCYYGQGQC